MITLPNFLRGRPYTNNRQAPTRVSKRPMNASRSATECSFMLFMLSM
jgi:hypothetical protein